MICATERGSTDPQSLFVRWPGVFHVFSLMCCAWFVGYCIFVYSSPIDHPRISDAERRYIVDSIAGEETFGKRPVRIGQFFSSVMTNGPSLAVLTAHFTNNWALYLMLTWMPKYMAEMLDFDIKSSGLLFIPYIVMVILANISGTVADSLSQRLGLRSVRVLFQCTGNIIPAAAFVVLGFVSEKYTAFMIMVVAVGCSGIAYSGYSSNIIEICPHHTGLFYGISNTLATVPGIVAPALAGAMVSKVPTEGQWQGVFAIAAGMYVVGDIIYVLLASSKNQECLNGKDDANGDAGKGTYSSLEDVVAQS